MIKKEDLLPYEMKVISHHYINDSKGILLSSNTTPDGHYDLSNNIRDKISNMTKTVLEGDYVLDTYIKSLIHSSKIQSLHREFKPSIKFNDISRVIGEHKMIAANHSSEKMLLKHHQDLQEHVFLLKTFD